MRQPGGHEMTKLVDQDHDPEDQDEQDIIDITPGTESEARQSDEDGDTTAVPWRAPDPNIEVTTSSQHIIGRGWVFGSQITLTIDSAVNGAGITYDAGVMTVPIGLRISMGPSVWVRAASFLVAVAVAAALVASRRAARRGIPEALAHA